MWGGGKNRLLLLKLYILKKKNKQISDRATKSSSSCKDRLTKYIILPETSKRTHCIRQQFSRHWILNMEAVILETRNKWGEWACDCPCWHLCSFQAVVQGESAVEPEGFPGWKEERGTQRDESGGTFQRRDAHRLTFGDLLRSAVFRFMCMGTTSGEGKEPLKRLEGPDRDCSYFHLPDCKTS